MIGFRLVLSLIAANEQTGKVKLLSFGFVLIAVWAPALMLAESVLAKNLILMPDLVTLELQGRNEAPGQLKIDQVYLEGSPRQFSYTTLSDQCDKNGDLIQSTPGEVCRISFVITAHLQNRLNFKFDLSRTNGVVDIFAPTGNHHYEFEPVSETGKSGNFPIGISAFSRKIIYPVNLAVWLSVLSVLTVIGIAGLSMASKYLKPRPKSIGVSDVWAFIAFAVIALIFANGRFGLDLSHSIELASDAGNISSFVAANENPQNFKTDPFLSNPNNFSMYFAFHLPLISTLNKLTGSYASAFMALVGPVTFLHLCGYYLLGKRFLTNRLLAFLFAIATAIPVSLPLFEYYGLSTDILPRSLYQALLPFALILLMELCTRPKYFWLALLVFTLLLYVHPVSGPAWVGVCLVTLLYFAIKLKGSRWWMYWLPAAFVFVLGVIPFVRAYFRPAPVSQVDPELFLQVQQARYAEQTRSVIDLYKQDVVATLQTNWVLLTLLLVALAFGGYSLLRAVKRLKKAAPKHGTQQSLLINLWWVVLVLVAVVVPLIDDFVSNTFGRPLMLREIRRTMRYFVPMLWLTFFWVSQQTLVYFGNAKQIVRQSLVWIAILSTLICYGIETEIWKNPILARQWECVRSGTVLCKTNADVLAKYEFYTELPKYVEPDKSVFPDPDPRYLADSLMPRYHSLRSVAYTYKDGEGVGDLLAEWWRITQELKPYLPAGEHAMDPKVADFARTTGATYFYFIHPDKNALEYLKSQKVLFQNDYGALISLK